MKTIKKQEFIVLKCTDNNYYGGDKGYTPDILDARRYYTADAVKSDAGPNDIPYYVKIIIKEKEI